MVIDKKKIFSVFKHFLSATVDIFFPRLCFFCERKIENGYLCKTCLGKIKVLTPPLCRLCSKELRNSKGSICSSCSKRVYFYDQLISVLLYREPIVTLIHLFKYKHYDFLNEFFSSLMVHYLLTIGFDFTGYDYITSVPNHPSKQREREYNQSSLLAKSLSQTFHVSFENLLICKKNKSSQTELPPEERFKNVKDAFYINPVFSHQQLSFKSRLKGKISEEIRGKNLKGKNVIFVDDIFTTGATVLECSRVLKNAGVNKITVLTLARA
ncbi:MAG: hypothetical protein B6D55_05430 [Candidatus Omnitrophica bacterium 4484_70.2]|nr:MAG: hypothetical protein B6D55_05430 [Candidatus Omnitrophica bacterium 4484_70.2]